MDGIFVYIITMDPLVKEQVVANPDGTFSIFINDCLSPERKIKAYNHALSHIRNGDFDNNIDVDIIECNTHKAVR